MGTKRVTVSDKAGMLARIARVEFAPSTQPNAPYIEFARPGEEAHTTVPSLRPDGAVVEISAGTDSGNVQPVFRGIVEYIDDSDDPDTFEGVLDIAELPADRCYRKKISRIYNAVPGLEGGYVATLGGEVGAGNSIGGSSSGGLGGAHTAHEIIRDVARITGTRVGTLDFPDYPVIGSFRVEHESTVDVANKLISPFNIYEFVRHFVRVDRDGLHVYRINFLESNGVSNARALRSIKSRKRHFESYVPDDAVGTLPILLTGAQRVQRVTTVTDNSLRNLRLPNNPPSGGSHLVDLAVIPYIEEKRVEETVTTKTSADGHNFANPSFVPVINVEGVEPSDDVPARDAEQTDVTITNTVVTHLLLTGYGADLPSTVAAFNTAVAANRDYARYLADESDDEIRNHIAADYPAVGPAQFGGSVTAYHNWLYQIATERLNNARARQHDLDTIALRINGALVNVQRDDIPGSTVQPGLGLARLNPADESVQATYDPDTHEQNGASLVPNVVFGDVQYVASLSQLAQIVTKSVTTTRARDPKRKLPSEQVQEVRVSSEFEIRRYEFYNKMVQTRETTETYNYENGTPTLDSKEVKSYLFDDHGDVVQTTIQKYTGFGTAWIHFNTQVEPTAKTSIEYRLQKFSDGITRLAPRQLEIDLANANYLVHSDYSGGFTGYNPYAANSPLAHELLNYTLETRNQFVGQYQLFNGQPFQPEDRFSAITYGVDTVYDPSSQQITDHNNRITRMESDQISAIGDAAALVDPSAPYYHLHFPNMDYVGLKLVYDLVLQQQNLEKKGAYWEICETECTLDLTLAVRSAVNFGGAIGTCVEATHKIDENSAVTMIASQRLIIGATDPDVIRTP